MWCGFRQQRPLGCERVRGTPHAHPSEPDSKHIARIKAHSLVRLQLPRPDGHTIHRFPACRPRTPSACIQRRVIRGREQDHVEHNVTGQWIDRADRNRRVQRRARCCLARPSPSRISTTASFMDASGRSTPIRTPPGKRHSASARCRSSRRGHRTVPARPLVRHRPWQRARWRHRGQGASCTASTCKSPLAAARPARSTYRSWHCGPVRFLLPCPPNCSFLKLAE